ncbi:hypothetical protein [Clostridium ganghwense]|uniref:Lipoprotein n=1 Tax=Clostridium ganghwense TaxID=312089 RepID=A0ABT4CR21_9CLOT|nr:hypothetical protein [Clostridium ganghwense]MCY6371484.1 hypothetical protein [Clostridium ganghwense]
MKKLSTNQKYLLIIGICILGFIVSICYFKIQKDSFVDRELENLYKLPTTYTLEDAVKDNIVDVTEVHNGQNEEINKFLSKVDKKSWAVLKTVQEIDNDLLITLYNFDNKINQIRSFKYYVKKQGGESPDKRFESYYTTNEEGISTVYLLNIPNTNFPNWESQILEDDVLYSYKE